MVNKRTEKSLEPFDSARPSAFMLLALRLKEEHEMLNKKVDALCELSVQTASAARTAKVIPMLDQLRHDAGELILDLDDHVIWEGGELSPAFARYFKRKIEPTMMPSMWVLEKDHELALQFFGQFMEQSEILTEIDYLFS